MKLSEGLSGFLFVLLGLLVLTYGASLPPMPGQQYGAGLFPMIIGAGFCLCGGVLIRNGWQARSSEALLKAEEWARDPGLIANFLLTLAAVLAFVLLIEAAGFLVLAFFTVLVFLLRFQLPLIRSLIISLLTAAAAHVIFAELMRVPMPAGVLQGVLQLL